jgi:hypothetical protein
VGLEGLGVPTIVNRSDLPQNRPHALVIMELSYLAPSQLHPTPALTPSHSNRNRAHLVPCPLVHFAQGLRVVVPPLAPTGLCAPHGLCVGVSNDLETFPLSRGCEG